MASDGLVELINGVFPTLGASLPPVHPRPTATITRIKQLLKHSECFYLSKYDILLY